MDFHCRLEHPRMQHLLLLTLHNVQQHTWLELSEHQLINWSRGSSSRRGLKSFAREEALLAQTCRKLEEHANVQVEHRLERVQERFVESYSEIRKVTPQLLEANDAIEPKHQIELLQGSWSQLAIHIEHLEVKLW
jgi:hypothetical protein